MRFLTRYLLLIAMLVPASAAFAQDGLDMRVCRLNWVTTSGPVLITREYDVSGTLIREATGGSMLFPSAPWGISGLSISQSRGIAQAEVADPIYALFVGLRSHWPRRLTLELDIGGELMTLTADRNDNAVPLTKAQANAILNVQGPVTYRFYKAGRKRGRLLEENQFDTRGHTPADLNGMGGLIQTASEALDAAERAADPPCMQVGDEFIADKWLQITCEEEFAGALGTVNLKPNRFSVSNGQIEGAVFNISAHIYGGSNTDAIDFTGANMLPRGVVLWAYGDNPQWQKNDPRKPTEQTQEFTITSGEHTLGTWLWNRRRYDLFYNDEKIATEIIAANAAIDVSVYDTSDDRLETFEIAAGWRDALEADLRTGWRNLQARERDPASQCTLDVQMADRHIII